MTEATYFVRSRGRVSGPFDLSALQKLIRRGQLARSDQVSPDKANWASASEFEDLFPVRGAGAVATAAADSSVTTPRGSDDPRAANAATTAPDGGGKPLFCYTQGGATVGPIPLGVLQALAKNGTLGPYDMVWQESAEVATPACQITHLADIFSSGGSRATRGRSSGGETASDEAVTSASGTVATQALLGSIIVAVLIIVFSVIPVFQYGDKTVWWWDLVGQSRNVLLSLIFVFHVAMALAVVIVGALARGIARSVTIISLTGISLSLWAAASLNTTGGFSVALLSLSTLMIPVFAGALLSITRFRNLQLSDHRGRILQGIMSGLLAMFSLSAAAVIIVEMTGELGPAPRWLIAAIITMVIGAVAGLAAGILGLVGASARYSRGVHLAAMICCLLATGLTLACSVTVAKGVANMADVLSGLASALADETIREAHIGGWIMFFFIRVVIVIYATIGLLGTGLLELLVSLSVREGSESRKM